ncbi:MAG: hypothetical protein MUF22_09965, partial [Chitinispirillaceae bacterium]|nr:hypothetical protein [Chitinispirillaceae bacterium]
MNRIIQQISLMLFVLAILGYGSEPAHQSTDAHQTAAPAAHAVKPMLSPDRAYTMLMEGNARYIAGRSLRLRQGEEQRYKTATDGQSPFVSILSCADSRVPPEIIFDAGIGELFIVRIAGNVADKTEIGTLEYGTGHLGTPLIVV